MVWETEKRSAIIFVKAIRPKIFVTVAKFKNQTQVPKQIKTSQSFKCTPGSLKQHFKALRENSHSGFMKAAFYSRTLGIPPHNCTWSSHPGQYF